MRKRTIVNIILIVFVFVIILSSLLYILPTPQSIFFFGKAKNSTIQSVAEFIASEMIEYPPEYAKSHFSADSTILAKSGLLPLSNFMIAFIPPQPSNERTLKVWSYEKDTLKSTTENDFDSYLKKTDEIDSAMKREPHRHVYAGLYGHCYFSISPLLLINNSILGVRLITNYGPLAGEYSYCILKHSGNKWKIIKKQLIHRS